MNDRLDSELLCGACEFGQTRATMNRIGDVYTPLTGTPGKGKHMGNRLHAITDPDTRRIVANALSVGWEYVGLSGTTHHVIEHVATGTRLSFAGSPKVASWKSLAHDIEAVSGRGSVWQRAHRKVSKKRTEHADFIGTHCPQLQREVGESTADAAEQYVQIWERMKSGYLSAPMARKLLHLEKNLRANYQPCPVGGRWFSEYYDDPTGETNEGNSSCERMNGSRS